MSTLRKHYSYGFTLVEILVVLALVAVLAALGLAVFSRVRERGRAATCQSNLKQIALATQQYTQDYNGQFPPLVYEIKVSPYGLYWYDLLQPYLKTKAVFWCPSSGLREQRLPNYTYNLFELNDVLKNRGRASTFVGSHESTLASVSDVVLNHDGWATYGDGVTIDGTPVQTSCGEMTVGSLHSGGANFSYVDGHVKWLSVAQQGKAWCVANKKLREKRTGEDNGAP